jgi:hypothetical protein
MEIKDSRILPLNRGDFRSKLTLDDVKHEGIKIYQIDNTFGRSENIGVCIENPIKITYINFYRSKITKKTDTYLQELVEDLMYFNYNIDMGGVKKMVTFLVNKCVKHVDDEPCLKYEDIYGTVLFHIKASRQKLPNLLSDVVVLFEKGTMLTSEERRAISLQTRALRGHMLNGELIHNAAITAIKLAKAQLNITRPRVLEQVEDRKIKTVVTLNKYIREDTVALLSKANVERHFKTERSLEKFKIFLTLPETMSLDEIARELEISKGTVVMFKKLLK